MRLAIIADTHLGFKYGSERGEDAFKNAANAFQLASSYDPDYIILLGDIFDHRVEKPEVLKRAMVLFKSLRGAPIAIYGTHETRHKDAVNPVHLLHQAGLVKLLHKSSISLEKDGQKVNIFGMSGVHDSFAKEELCSWNPQPSDGFNILLLHQTFREDLPFGDAMSYSDLPKFDLYLFGHIHNMHENSISGAPVLYPGSTIRTQLAKQNTELGFYILEVTNNQLKKDFIKIPSRDFYYVELLINHSPAEIVSKISSEIESKLGNKPLIKVKLKGKLKEGFTPSDLQLGKLFKNYKDVCFLSIDKSNLESEQIGERLKVLADLGQKQESIESLGIDLLARKLKETKLPKQKLAELFEKLAAGELDAAEILLSAEKPESKSICADAVKEKPVSQASWQETFQA